MEDWVKIFVSRNFLEAEMIKGRLEENNIPVMVLNKQDSSYLAFGDIEVYVPSLMKEVAINVLDKGISN